MNSVELKGLTFSYERKAAENRNNVLSDIRQYVVSVLCSLPFIRKSEAL